MTKRQSILAAAVELFSERGFAGTPTVEVARQAGVAEGTIFHHFKTKEGLLAQILMDLLDRYTDGAAREAERAGSGLEGVENLIRYHLWFSRRYEREARVVLRDFPPEFLSGDCPTSAEIAARVERFVDLLGRCLERGCRDGTIRPLPVEETALVVRGMLHGLTRQMLLGPLEVPDLTEAAVDFCRRSLVSAPDQTREGKGAS